MTHPTKRSAVYALFTRDNDILLGKRKNTGRWDGYFSPPCGGMEADESIRDALFREIKEECAVHVEDDDVSLVHVRHRKGPDWEAVQYYFQVTGWDDDIVNAEPGLCENWDWYPLDDLPRELVPHTAQVIGLWRRGVRYSQSGW